MVCCLRMCFDTVTILIEPGGVALADGHGLGPPCAVG